MPYPDIPTPVKAMLANERHRTHHHLWHFVRNSESWNDLPQVNKDQLIAAGWQAPRFDQEPGSGIDFLGMHRQMIAMTNSALVGAGHPDWLNVKGWDPIPFASDDSDWPEPAWQNSPPAWATEELWDSFTALAIRARNPERISEMQQLSAVFKNHERLKTMTLDELGIAMEWSIHGWMHMRWSGAPMDDGFAIEPENDWLFVPWSSHVNKVFWKLHGWIDERISDWEAATGEIADLSSTWAGPTGVPGAMPHMAEAELLRHLPARETVPSPMMIREHIVEGLLR